MKVWFEQKSSNTHITYLKIHKVSYIFYVCILYMFIYYTLIKYIICSTYIEIYMYWKWKWNRSVVSNSLRPHGLYVAYETPPSLEFSRQENWSGLPFHSPGDLPDPGIEPMSPALQADAFITGATREADVLCVLYIC